MSLVQPWPTFLSPSTNSLHILPSRLLNFHCFSFMSQNLTLWVCHLWSNKGHMDSHQGDSPKFIHL